MFSYLKNLKNNRSISEEEMTSNIRCKMKGYKYGIESGCLLTLHIIRLSEDDSITDKEFIELLALVSSDNRKIQKTAKGRCSFAAGFTKTIQDKILSLFLDEEDSVSTCDYGVKYCTSDTSHNKVCEKIEAIPFTCGPVSISLKKKPVNKSEVYLRHS